MEGELAEGKCFHRIKYAYMNSRQKSLEKHEREREKDFSECEKVKVKLFQAYANAWLRLFSQILYKWLMMTKYLVSALITGINETNWKKFSRLWRFQLNQNTTQCIESEAMIETRSLSLIEIRFVEILNDIDDEEDVNGSKSVG